MGSTNFLFLIIELLTTSGLLYVALALALATHPVFKGNSWMNFLTRGAGAGGGLMGSCAVGFSAVLFGLKAVLFTGSPGWSQIMGVSVPTKYAAWAELVAVQLIAPEASLLGHLCGIVSGMLHVYVTKKCIRAWQRRRGGSRSRYTSSHGTWGGTY